MSKTVFITGTRKGLGLDILKTFAAEGFNVVAHGRENASFRNQCEEISEKMGVKITPICFDLSDYKQVVASVNSFVESGAIVDVLVNNAGVSVIKPTMYVEYEDLLNTFNVNYFSAVLISKIIGNMMLRMGHGSIINITSMGSLGHQPGGACYDASKAALNQFTISYAHELAPFNVNVNAVACGPLKTDMFDTMSEDVKKKLLKTVAFKRAAELPEISKLVLFLASSDASYITGQIIRADGGAIL